MLYKTLSTSFDKSQTNLNFILYNTDSILNQTPTFMGQINCQQCTIPSLSQYPSSISNIDKKSSIQPPRINILSKNRNSIEIFNKKYSLQTTQQDTEDPSTLNKTLHKEKCLLTLQKENQVFFLEIQKNKKFFMGTSKNCHLVVKGQNIQAKFKIQFFYSDTQFTAVDMGFGLGTYIKCSFTEISEQKNKQISIFLIDENLIRLSVDLINQGQKFLKVKIQDMKSQLSREFSLDCIDIFLGRRNRKIVQFDQTLKIDLQIQNTSVDKFRVCFNHPNSWRYLKNNSHLMSGDSLRMGSSVYTIKNINFNPDYSNQNQIKNIVSN